MAPYSLQFLRYLLGLRKPWTSLGTAEHNLLSRLTSGKKCIVEVGVFEGATSRIICQSMDAQGKLYLVDPYPQDTMIEKMLSVSFAEFVAKKQVLDWSKQVQFIRSTSVDAAIQLGPLLKNQIELVFIDAEHRYQFVKEDFQTWGPLLSPTGLLVFDDTQDEAYGPGLLCKEIANGLHGDWTVLEKVGNETVVKRKAAPI